MMMATEGPMSDNDRRLSIEKAENGYIARVSWCTGTGMKRQYHDDSYVLTELPDEIKNMLAGKISGKKVSKKGAKKADVFDAATKKAAAKLK
jgi:hypothetical protein